MREAQSLKNNFSKDYQAKIIEKHGEATWNSVKAFMKYPAKRKKIEEDGINPNPLIRNAKMHSDRLKFYKIGAFPKQDAKLYDLFGERRSEGRQVTRS